MESSNTDVPPLLNLLDLPSSLLVEALSSLPPASAASLACSSKALINVADDETLRKQHLLDIYGISSFKSPPSHMTCTDTTLPPSSFNEAFKSWAEAFPTRVYKNEMVKVAHNAWQKVESFLQASHLPIFHSLLPGTHEEQLLRLESSLDVNLPPAFKILYRFHGGQQLSFDDKFDKAQRCPAGPQVALDPSIAHGLFGGYSFYDNFKCVRMLSLARIEHWTSRLRHHSWLVEDEIKEDEGWVARCGRLIAFAASFDMGKIFALDCDSSEVLILSGGRLQSCCPVEENGILAWFVEYAERLHSGWYQVRTLHESMPFDTKGISLFAENGPGVSIAITRGVQVKVSVIYAAEITRDDQHTFTYSVRFQLLPREEQLKLLQRDSGGGAGSGIVSSCQLNARHWLIFNDLGTLEDDVRGEAVIGLHPHLHEGGPEFKYQSCTRAQISNEIIKGRRHYIRSGVMPPLIFELGRMRGDFEFVEGSRSMPTGPTFDVICPSFSLSLQQGYLY